MRLRKNIMLSALLLIFCLSIFLLAACDTGSSSTPSGGSGGDEQNQSGDNTPELVEISSRNYSDYLTVSVELTDSNIEYIGENALGLDSYVLSCVGNIRVSRRGNYQFENVYIAFGITVQGWLNEMMSGNIELDYDGYGQYSFSLSKESFSNKFDLTSRDVNVSVYAARGNIVINKG